MFKNQNLNNKLSEIADKSLFKLIFLQKNSNFNDKIYIQILNNRLGQLMQRFYSYTIRIRKINSILKNNLSTFILKKKLKKEKLLLKDSLIFLKNNKKEEKINLKFVNDKLSCNIIKKKEMKMKMENLEFKIIKLVKDLTGLIILKSDFLEKNIINNFLKLISFLNEKLNDGEKRLVEIKKNLINGLKEIKIIKNLEQKSNIKCKDPKFFNLIKQNKELLSFKFGLLNVIKDIKNGRDFFKLLIIEYLNYKDDKKKLIELINEIFKEKDDLINCITSITDNIKIKKLKIKKINYKFKFLSKNFIISDFKFFDNKILKEFQEINFLNLERKYKINKLIKCIILKFKVKVKLLIQKHLLFYMVEELGNFTDLLNFLEKKRIEYYNLLKYLKNQFNFKINFNLLYKNLKNLYKLLIQRQLDIKFLLDNCSNFKLFSEKLEQLDIENKKIGSFFFLEYQLNFLKNKLENNKLLFIEEKKIKNKKLIKKLSKFIIRKKIEINMLNKICNIKIKESTTFEEMVIYQFDSFLDRLEHYYSESYPYVENVLAVIGEKEKFYLWIKKVKTKIELPTGIVAPAALVKVFLEWFVGEKKIENPITCFFILKTLRKDVMELLKLYKEKVNSGILNDSIVSFLLNQASLIEAKKLLLKDNYKDILSKFLFQEFKGFLYYLKKICLEFSQIIKDIVIIEEDIKIKNINLQELEEQKVNAGYYINSEIDSSSQINETEIYSEMENYILESELEVELKNLIFKNLKVNKDSLLFKFFISYKDNYLSNYFFCFNYIKLLNEENLAIKEVNDLSYLLQKFLIIKFLTNIREVKLQKKKLVTIFFFFIIILKIYC